MRFNPPPNWPTPPPGWTPPEGWQPDPAWGPQPPGWQLWIDDAAPTEVVSAETVVQAHQYSSGWPGGGPASAVPPTTPKSKRGLLIGAGVGAVVLIGAVVAGVLLLGKDSEKSDEDTVEDLVYSVADAYNNADAGAFNDLLCEDDRFGQTDDEIRQDLEQDGEVTIESVDDIKIDGELATAEVTSREANKDESDTDTFEFKLIDGEWFICNH